MWCRVCPELLGIIFRVSNSPKLDWILSRVGGGGHCGILSDCFGLLGMKFKLNYKRNELAFVFVLVTNSQSFGAVRLPHRVWPLPFLELP